MLAFRSVLSLARRPRRRVVTPIAVHSAALQSPVRRSPVPHAQTQLDHSSRTSPSQPGPCLVRVPKQVAPAAPPRPAATDTARFPDTRGSWGAGRDSPSLFCRYGRFYSGARGTEAGRRTTIPRLPRGRGISRSAPQQAGLAERGGPASPPPPAASRGGAARPGPLPVLVAAAEPWGWAGAGGDGTLTGKVPAGGHGQDAERMTQPGGEGEQRGLSWRRLQDPASPLPVSLTRGRLPSSREAAGKGGGTASSAWPRYWGTAGAAASRAPPVPPCGCHEKFLCFSLPIHACSLRCGSCRLSGCPSAMVPVGGGRNRRTAASGGGGTSRTSIFRWSRRGGSGDSPPWIPGVDGGAGLLLPVQDGVAEV